MGGGQTFILIESFATSIIYSYTYADGASRKSGFLIAADSHIPRHIYYPVYHFRLGCISNCRGNISAHHRVFGDP